MSETIMKEEERIAFALRALYKQYGYLPYKMNKFESYDLYVANKEFLSGDGVIAFNDTDGKLLALKPDVTLSIIKNDADDGAKRKVCYNENVYRISEKTRHFKEIMQSGLECIGDIDAYDIFECVFLAAASLATISPSFVLEISHLGILSALLEEIGGGETFDCEVMKKIADKNAHELSALCQEIGVDEEKQAQLASLIGVYGEPDFVLERLSNGIASEKARAAIEKLRSLWALLKKTPYASHIRIDFSVVNDMHYYSDIVFKGFIDGIGEGVLSGGRYDHLLARMGRKSGGIGFAVDLDALSGFGERQPTTDVDVLVLYADTTEACVLADTVQSLVKEGFSVTTQKTKGSLRYGRILDLTGGAQ